MDIYKFRFIALKNPNFFFCLHITVAFMYASILNKTEMDQ